MLLVCAVSTLLSKIHIAQAAPSIEQWMWWSADQRAPHTHRHTPVYKILIQLEFFMWCWKITSHSFRGVRQAKCKCWRKNERKKNIFIFHWFHLTHRSVSMHFLHRLVMPNCHINGINFSQRFCRVRINSLSFFDDEYNKQMSSNHTHSLKRTHTGAGTSICSFVAVLVAAEI